MVGDAVAGPAKEGSQDVAAALEERLMAKVSRDETESDCAYLRLAWAEAGKRAHAAKNYAAGWEFMYRAFNEVEGGLAVIQELSLKQAEIEKLEREVLDLRERLTKPHGLPLKMEVSR